ncbi:MAG: serine/threonine protein kinase [Deltaproteobacteria bacterium]|nr:serine/threonine protein kinase [Deltaproteobacteria bacterium]
MSALAVLPPIGRLGRYELLGKLATGGVAEIYVGRPGDTKEGPRFVVLKRIHPALAENATVKRDFLHEAKLMMGLSHPNLATLYDVGEESGALFLAMEWVRGVSLRKMLDISRRKKEPLPIPLVVALFVDVASALSHVHAAKDASGKPLRIVHRDVTPENVVVAWSGVPKLLDFGVAKSDAASRTTDAGVVKGKYAYMSPEQWGGEAIDARSDLFALAASLHEALTGERLYDRPTPMATMAAIVLQGPPAAPSASRPEVPAELDRIVAKGLAQSVEDRYASADEMRADLEAVAVSLEKDATLPRDQRLNAFLRALFPGEAEREPILDRKPPSMRFAVEAPREPTPDDLQLRAEAEIEGDAMLREQRSRQRTVALVVALLVVATIAFVVVNLR